MGRRWPGRRASCRSPGVGGRRRVDFHPDHARCGAASARSPAARGCRDACARRRRGSGRGAGRRGGEVRCGVGARRRNGLAARHRAQDDEQGQRQDTADDRLLLEREATVPADAASPRFTARLLLQRLGALSGAAASSAPTAGCTIVGAVLELVESRCPAAWRAASAARRRSHSASAEISSGVGTGAAISRA